MFHEDPEQFPPPKDVDTPIWRYMNFTQFVFLLKRQCLHFTRPDRFTDQFEGCLPERWLQRVAKVSPNHRTLMAELFKDLRMRTCVNCWHANTHESEAMWKLYLKNDEGIAIRSTYARLTKCFDSSDDVCVHVGTIQYIDHSKFTKSPKHAFSPLLYKRMSFAHEREIRAIAFESILSTDESGRTQPQLKQGSQIDVCGKDLPVDLATLIDAVYVSPKTHEWFKTLVQDVVQTLGFGFPVRQSDLDKDPVW